MTNLADELEVLSKRANWSPGFGPYLSSATTEMETRLRTSVTFPFWSLRKRLKLRRQPVPSVTTLCSTKLLMKFPVIISSVETPLISESTGFKYDGPCLYQVFSFDNPHHCHRYLRAGARHCDAAVTDAQPHRDIYAATDHHYDYKHNYHHHAHQTDRDRREDDSCENSFLQAPSTAANPRPNLHDHAYACPRSSIGAYDTTCQVPSCA